MKIIKQKKYYGFTSKTADEHCGLVILEDGTWLLVHENGSAMDTNGRRYVPVSKEETDGVILPDRTEYVYMSVTNPDFDEPEPQPITDYTLATVGWTTDADKPVVLRKNELQEST